MELNIARQSVTAVLVLSLSSLLTARSEPLLRIASDDWCPFVCAEEGKLTGGYLVVVTAQAMSLAGYRIEPVQMPLNRAIRESLSGGIEGVYAPPVDQRLLLSAPLAYSRACFYTRAGETWTYQGINSLRKLTVGIIDDYGYDHGPMDAYILKNRNKPLAVVLAFGVTAGITNLQKLLVGRYPVMLEHEAVMARLTQKMDVVNRVRQAGCLERALPLTIGFAKQDIRGEKWIRDLANGLHQMEASGRLNALRQRYDIPQVMPQRRCPNRARGRCGR